MAKKKNKDEDIMTFNPVIGIKGNTNNINSGKPTYKIENIPPPQCNNFLEIKNKIHNLESGKCITVTIGDTNLNVYQLQSRISGIAHNHKNKFTDKEFKTSIIDDETVRCWRIK